MKFSVYYNGKQANNVHGYPKMDKDSDWNNHRSNTYRDAFSYAKRWLAVTHNVKNFDLQTDASKYYTCLNEGKAVWSYDGKNSIEIRRED